MFLGSRALNVGEAVGKKLARSSVIPGLEKGGCSIGSKGFTAPSIQKRRPWPRSSVWLDGKSPPCTPSAVASAEIVTSLCVESSSLRRGQAGSCCQGPDKLVDDLEALLDYLSIKKAPETACCAAYQ